MLYLSNVERAELRLSSFSFVSSWGGVEGRASPPISGSGSSSKQYFSRINFSAKAINRKHTPPQAERPESQEVILNIESTVTVMDNNQYKHLPGGMI